MEPIAAVPHVIRGERLAGTALDWSKACLQCPTRQCESAKSRDVGMCSYGFNYLRATEDVVLVGFLLKEHRLSSPARSDNFRKYPDWVVPRSQIDKTINTLVEARIEVEIDLQAQKNDIIKQYVDEQQYRVDFLERLKPEIQRGLSFVHDYKQINTQISQNINVIIETRYQGADLEEKLSKASHAEVAIYWASKFLQEKLNVARLLLDPGWINRESEKTLFRFHGQVTKYQRIYQYMFQQKQLKLASLGKSYGKVYGNSDAVGVIPHTFFDNALKYSPQGERVEVFVSDESAGIEFSVSSYGPKIEENEKGRIFQAFVRGIHAEATGEEGAGYGLYVAQFVAHVLKTSISVEQDLGRRKEDRYWTTFTVVLPMNG